MRWRKDAGAHMDGTVLISPYPAYTSSLDLCGDVRGQHALKL